MVQTHNYSTRCRDRAMNYTELKNTAQSLREQASFVVEIVADEEYEQALALMDELIDDYDNHPVLIELLSKSIEQWENSSSDFAEFNQCTSRPSDGGSTPPSSMST